MSIQDYPFLRKEQEKAIPVVPKSDKGLNNKTMNIEYNSEASKTVENECFLWEKISNQTNQNPEKKIMKRDTFEVLSGFSKKE